VTAACVALAGLAATGACYRERHCHEQCDGNTRVTCGGGGAYDYRSGEEAREDCGQRRCVESFRSYGAYTACALGGREQRCNPELDDVFCDGEKITTCRGEYVEARDDCAGLGLLCAVEPTYDGMHEGRCVESRTPDSRCASDVHHLFCDGDVRAGCFGRLLVHAKTSCAATGQRCVERGDTAACE
jgi:hypothetical protein